MAGQEITDLVGYKVVANNPEIETTWPNMVRLLFRYRPYQR
jgi:hypothetical protein